MQIEHPGVIVDRIGELESAIAALQDQLNPLKELLKAQAPAEYNGDLFRTVVYQTERKTVAWQKIAMKLGASKQMIAGNTTTTTVTTLKTTARKAAMAQKVAA